MSEEDFDDAPDELRPEHIQAVYDALQEEPMYINEASRKLGINVAQVSWVVNYLVGRGELSVMEVEPSHRESSPIPVARSDVGGYRREWYPYKVAFGSGVSGEEVDEKLKVCRYLSSAGENIARELEKALVDAVREFDVSWEESDFNSEKTDVKIALEGRAGLPDVGAEVSARTEVPINKRYVEVKRRDLFADTDLVIIAPRFLDSVYEKYPQEVSYQKTVFLYEYPEDYPALSNYDFSDQFMDLLDRVERSYVSITYDDYVSGLVDILDNHLPGGA